MQIVNTACLLTFLSLCNTSSSRDRMICRPVNGRQQSASSLLVLDIFLPLGTKKAAKVYIIACHPLLPHVVAIGANAGEFDKKLTFFACDLALCPSEIAL